MILNRKSVELLAPAGTWDALVAGVDRIFEIGRAHV